MEKARCNIELYSNLRAPLNNVKPSNFWGSHHSWSSSFCIIAKLSLILDPFESYGHAVPYQFFGKEVVEKIIYGQFQFPITDKLTLKST